jgi:hypothetical protein
MKQNEIFIDTPSFAFFCDVVTKKTNKIQLRCSNCLRSFET